MKRFFQGLMWAWITRNGFCWHPFYCVLLSNERKNQQRKLVPWSPERQW